MGNELFTFVVDDFFLPFSMNLSDVYNYIPSLGMQDTYFLCHVGLTKSITTACVR